MAISGGHLTDEEIDVLLGLRRLRQVLADETATRDRAAQHVQGCPECERAVSAADLVEGRLGALHAVQEATPTPECPPLGDWDAMVAQGGQRAERAWLHAALCDHCGPLLRAATERGGGRPAGDQGLVGLSPERQHSIAERMASGSRRPHAPYRALAAAAALIIAATAWLAIDRRSPSISDLLARAYAEQRTLDLRLGESSHGPVRLQRASPRSRLDRPASLLEAEARISRSLERQPLDPEALHNRGRAEILEANYGAAVESLTRADQHAPRSAAIKRELATAYFMRGRAEDRPTDIALAFEKLGQALALAPDDRVALFNRAFVGQYLGLNDQAASDWTRYLELDPTGEWAAEARTRLSQLQEAMRRSGDAKPLLEPSAYARASQRMPAPEQRDEEYLHVAIRDWLPVALTQAPSSEGREARRGLDALAKIFRERHGDAWLADLLAQSTPAGAAAVLELSQGMRAADAGDFDGAIAHAQRSASLFEPSGSLAGQVRAEANLVYALHLSERAAECLRQAATLRGRVPAAYPYVASQLAIEEAICSNMMGAVGASEAHIQRAQSTARRASLKVTELRAAAFSASLALSTGEPDLAMRRVSAGLAESLKGRYPVMRVYNLLSVLDSLAEEREWWWFQLAVGREELGLLKSERDTLLLAMAHRRLGLAAMRVGDAKAAARALNVALELFKSCPQTESTRNNQVESEVWLARLDVDRGEPQAARQRLAAIEGSLDTASTRFVSIDFHQTRGQALLAVGDVAGAEKSLRRALAIRNEALNTISAPADRVAWQEQGQRAFRALTAILLDRSASESALAVWESYLAAPETNVSQPSVHVLRKHLTDRTVVVFAFVGNGVAAWAYDDRLVQGTWAPSMGREVEAMASRFASACADPDSSQQQIVDASRQLYQILLKPLEPALRANRAVVIEADGPLGRVPFATLVDGQGKRFGEARSITQSEGVYSRVASSRSPAIGRDSRILLVTPMSQEREPLADAVEEAQSIVRLFPAATVLNGADATVSRVAQELRRNDLLHFAGHTSIGAAGPDLLLSFEDPRASRISALDVSRVRLAVLSGCSSIGVRLDAGAGSRRSLIGLTRAGVPQVVASLWDVDSAATRAFMGVFYETLLRGEPVGESVRIAAARVRAQPGWSHPYYWAGFGAFGRL